jgi:hypothetical protein
MRSVLTVVLVLLSLTGCAKPTARSLTLPDGSAGLAIRCGGSNMLISDCYAKAGELCPKGYSVLTSDTFEQPSMMATSAIAVAGSYTAREMLVKCH